MIEQVKAWKSRDYTVHNNLLDALRHEITCIGYAIAKKTEGLHRREFDEILKLADELKETLAQYDHEWERQEALNEVNHEKA